MESIAYLMHVDINWIKQRPHFLAEKLSNHLNMDVFYIRNYKNKILSKKQIQGNFCSIKKITKIPFSSKISTLKMIEKICNHKSYSYLYKNEYKFLWITSPLLLEFIDLIHFKNTTIIYDCMDDILAFPESKTKKKYLVSLEKKLIDASSYVFSSSAVLKERLLSRGAKEVYVINNAIEPDKFVMNTNYKLFNKNKITYFGTIDQWLDFKIILKILDTFQDIHIELIGPNSVEIPVHERLSLKPSMEHKDLVKLNSSSIAFIMPFIVTELIKAVDPVKVYEYIALGKPCFVIKYPETEKFGDFVYLYENDEDIIHKIKQAKSQDWLPKISQEERQHFLNENSWAKRIEDIQKILSVGTQGGINILSNEKTIS